MKRVKQEVVQLSATASDGELIEDDFYNLGKSFSNREIGRGNFKFRLSLGSG